MVDAETWSDWSVIWISDDNIDEAIRDYDQLDVECIGLSHHKGYSNGLDVLKGLKHVRGVVIPWARELGISVKDLQDYPDLEFIGLGENSGPIDFRRFGSLQELIVDWTPGVVLPDEAQQELVRMIVRGYKSQDGTLDELPPFPSLKALEFTHGPLKDLSGIHRLPELEKCSFRYLSKLQSVGSLGGTSVKTLEFENCKNIVDLSDLSRCRNLEKVILYKCGSLPSLECFLDFPRLRWLSFVKTDILDGDMSVLLELKLDYVGFDKKKKYSHTSDEVRAELDRRKEPSAD